MEMKQQGPRILQYIAFGKGKGNIILVNAMQAYWAMEVHLQPFITLALERCDW